MTKKRRECRNISDKTAHDGGSRISSMAPCLKVMPVRAGIMTAAATHDKTLENVAAAPFQEKIIPHAITISITLAAMSPRLCLV